MAYSGEGIKGGSIYFDPATGAITGCDSSVTRANIPNSINGVAVTSIGESAFRNHGLMSVTIPNSVSINADGAFDGCSLLTDVYYSGSEAQWNAISIDPNNAPLTSATIHYNGQAPGTEKIPVHSTDEKDVLDAALKKVDFANLFENVSTGAFELRGPEISLAGMDFPLFEFESELNLPFKKVPVQISADYEKKTEKCCWV